MNTKVRINELDINSKEYKARLEKLRSEVEVLNKDIERYENILHQIEIERKTLVTLNNIYKDPYPDTEIEINFIRK